MLTRVKKSSCAEDAELWNLVRQELFYYSDMFDLALRSVKVLPPHKDFYGDCSSDSKIRIQLRRNGELVFAYQLIDTMAHELAHLKYPNHKRRWFDLHVRILQSMAEDDLYARLRKVMKHG